MMRILIFSLIFASSVAYSAASEDMSYSAIFPNNKVVELVFSADGEDWNDNQSIYSNKNFNKFSYCWEDDEEKFYCSETKSKDKAVVYEKGPENGRLKSQAEHLFKANIKQSSSEAGHEYGKFDRYFVCKKGCSSSMPKFIYINWLGGC